MQPEVRVLTIVLLRQFSYCCFLQFQAIAACVCTHYKKLEIEEKKHFLGLLAGDLGVKHDEVHTNAQRLLDTFTQVRPCICISVPLSPSTHFVAVIILLVAKR